MEDFKEVHIWNVKFTIMDVNRIAECVDAWLSAGRKGIQITGVDYNVTVLAQKDESLRRAIENSDIVNVDSFLPAKFLKKAGYGDGERVPTPDVMDALIAQAERTGRKVFFLGATDDTLSKMRSVLEKEYPKLVIAGMRNGYFGKDGEPAVVSEIASASPDYLFIGMPSPQKEQFIGRYKDSLPVGCFYGVGGAFDAKSGVLSRPPKWLQGCGMEGILRVVRNPRVYGCRIRTYLEFFKIVSKKA